MMWARCEEQWQPTNGVLIDGLNHLLRGHDKAILCEVHKLLLHIKIPAFAA